MKIQNIRVKNYRTLENITVNFPAYFSALCGRNDSGKSNIVRVVRAIIREDEKYRFRYDSEISGKEDFPKWARRDGNDEQIECVLELSIFSDQDTALHQFISTHLKIEDPPPELNVIIHNTWSIQESSPKTSIVVCNRTYTGLEAEEVLKRIQTSKTIFFHNSTELSNPYRYDEVGAFLTEFAPALQSTSQEIATSINKTLKSKTREPQKQLTELLGRLGDQYKVGITVPEVQFEYFPLNITLGDRKIDVPLRDWGSGTKNRTQILLTLFKARQISQAETTTEKITPIIVIEEPESFLHPGAQAEFGQVIQDLAEEFKVQVIVTTHSPYMLSHANPQSNILLSRATHGNQFRATEIVDTSGDAWMEPFGLALGISSSELEPWRKLFFSSGDHLLLVEGETDKEYFELLKDASHGDKALQHKYEIYPYNGVGNLQNNVLLKFLLNRYKKVFVTFDLDSGQALENTLKQLSLQPKKDFLSIGKNAPGKRNIEGLLPETITSSVYSRNTSIVQAATNGTKEEQKEAKSFLKKKMLEEFRRQATATNEMFAGFYPVVQTINKAFNE